MCFQDPLPFICTLSSVHMGAHWPPVWYAVYRLGFCAWRCSYVRQRVPGLHWTYAELVICLTQGQKPLIHKICRSKAITSFCPTYVTYLTEKRHSGFNMKCVWVNCDMEASVTGVSSYKNLNYVIFTTPNLNDFQLFFFFHTMKVNRYVTCACTQIISS